MSMPHLHIALCQMLVVDSKEANIAKAKNMINEAAEKGAQIIMLPEMFNCPYDIQYFRSYAEQLPAGETMAMLAAAARKNKIYLIGGSIPEIDQQGNVYNTSLLYDPQGNLIGKHRKIHLFDIHIQGRISFQESRVLTPGNAITVVDTAYGRIGIAVCYDIRFPELFRTMAQAGATLIFVPAAFNMTTGPLHWETLFRSRALDNQVFVMGNSPARNEDSSYRAYGHSLVVNPWGQVIARATEKETILNAILNMAEINETREAIPVWQHRRPDVYQIN